MNLQLTALILYSVLFIAIGFFISRKVRKADDFLVAGRRLGPGLLATTFLAANIGAGSTVGATGLGYAFGWSAWWWVGSAAIGCLILAVWVGPSMRRVAAEHNLRTVGDYLERRYDRRVRGVIRDGWLFIPSGAGRRDAHPIEVRLRQGMRVTAFSRQRKRTRQERITCWRPRTRSWKSSGR